LIHPVSIGFGDVVVVDSSKTDSVQVTNVGTSLLTIASVTSDNTLFTVTPTGGSVAPSGSMRFYVTFSPTERGSQTGDIVFVHDGPSSRDTVTVSGEGIPHR
jgi:hypothetical protein